MLSKEQVFKKVKRHLLKQEERATYRNGFVSSCRMRTKAGLRCAIGCLIPKSRYNPAIERTSLSKAYTRAANVLGESLRQSGVEIYREKEMHDLLVDLQRLHDSTEVGASGAELNRLEAKHFPKGLALMLTKQEIYNKVKTHLLTQGEQSVDGMGQCMYRSPKGLKCAAG